MLLYIDTKLIPCTGTMQEQIEALQADFFVRQNLTIENQTQPEMFEELYNGQLQDGTCLGQQDDGERSDKVS